MLSLYPDFRELLQLLNSEGARYLVVGGYAVNFHGHHRNTKDLDVWITMFGREPVRVDILTDPSGVDFDACYDRRVEAELDGVRVPFLALSDLRANKRAAGRTRDRADLESLPDQP